MNPKEIAASLIAVLEKYRSLLIYVQGSPDPDVIASSFALKIIGNRMGVKSKIIALTETSLPQNRALIDDLNIPIHFERSIPDLSNFEAYSILDYQTAYIKGVSEKIPCAIHIDHHESVGELLNVDIKIVIEEIGSTSTIMALVLKELEMAPDEYRLKEVCTALYYGIQTDTDNMKHANEQDYVAIKFLSCYLVREIIENIADFPLSVELANLLSVAMKNHVIYKDWLITGVGFLNELLRDNIALIADFLLNRENIKTVIVFAGIEKAGKKKLTLDASIRTEDVSLDLNELIKKITSEGGARRYKGAYQVDLDYFVNCPDRSQLWDVIRITTIEVLKKNRDMIYIIELKGLFKKVKRKVKKFINK